MRIVGSIHINDETDPYEQLMVIVYQHSILLTFTNLKIRSSLTSNANLVTI